MAEPRSLGGPGSGDREGHPFHGNQWTDGEEIEASEDLKETLFHSNYYQGAYYFIRSTGEEVSKEVGGTLEKTRRGFLLKDQQGRVLGPTGKDRRRPKWRALGVNADAESPIHAIADRHAAKLSVAIRYAFALARKAAAKQPTLERARSVAVTTLRAELKELLAPRLVEMFVAGGEVGVEALNLKTLEEFRTAKRPGDTDVDFAFNAKTQAAIDWADRHAAELIDGISETSREAINNAVAEYLETGDWREYRDEILAAVGSAERADLIARNESMVAVHMGQREAWRQATKAGLLSGTEKRVWITVGDEKMCPICKGLNGKKAALGKSYRSGGEEYEGPPAHVSCRCSEGLA